MTFAKYSLQKPVTILMIVISIIVLGFISLQRLPLELLPDFSVVNLSVTVSYPSSSPSEIDRDITRPLEEALATLNNLENFNSSSSNRSTIQLEFKEGTNMDIASVEIRDRIDQVRDLLPEDIDSIRINHWNQDAWPVFRFSVGWNGKRKDLNHFLEEILRPRLERITGVGNVDIGGFSKKQILIEIDPNQLQSLGIDIFSVTQALRSNNLTYSGGYVFDGDRKYTVRTMGEFRDVTEIAGFPLSVGDLTLGDISKIRYDFPKKNSFMHLNGNDSVNVSIQKSSNANIVQVCQAARDELEQITTQPQYKNLFQYKIINDQSKEIVKSINNLSQAGLVGGFLACLILFLFLRKFLTTLIIAVAIPISVLCTFAFMYLLRVGTSSQISLNLITLMGLMVAIGMLVDASVVVMENIFRIKQEKGLDALTAAVQGTQEVSVAVLASVATTISVFASFMFLEGTMAKFLGGFGTTVSVALLASLVVALTWIPLASSRILTGKEKKKQKSLLLLKNSYAVMMEFLLRKRVLVLIVMAGLAWASYTLLMRIDREQMPRLAQREITLDSLFEKSFSLSKMESIHTNVEQMLLERKEKLEIESITSRMGGRLVGRDGKLHGSIQIYLKEMENPTPTQLVQKKILAVLPVIPGLEFKPTQLRRAGGGSLDIEVILKGEDPFLLKMYSDIVKKRILEIPEILQALDYRDTGTDEIHVKVDSLRSENFGVSPLMVARTLSSALNTRAITRIKGDQGEIDLVVQIPESKDITLQTIENIHFENRTGEMIPLYSVVDFSYRKGPFSISRENRKSTIKIYCEPQHGASNFLTNTKVTEALSSISLPPGYSLELGKSWHRFLESQESNLFAIGLALILMYIIMASLFESFIHPFTILFTVPFSMIGVAGVFYLTNTTLNAMSYLGILVLFGLVVNNGIILIDHINQLRKSGLSRNDAIIQGGRNRLRPILMTALTSLCGLLPLTLPFFLPDLFPNTEGRARMWAPVSLAVFGGLTTSTFLTLLILPTIYSWMDDLSYYGLLVARFLLSLPEKLLRSKAKSLI